ncbi:MAG: dihydroorotase family protein [Proteobacteria bacterium]|nr:dihydroorotase family protein [Pseudomonadota bacterium]MCP4916109.1 dihydroorotase family protein [Pseudomonadota bacterium]
MYDLVIQDATIVSHTGRLVADIAIKGKTIAYVGPRAPGRAREKMSAIGQFVMPGIIDSSVHLRVPGNEGYESWETASRAAISAGVTTMLDRPTGDRPTVDLASLKARRSAAKGSSRANFGFWAAATKDNLDETRRMLDAGAIACHVDMSSEDGLLGMTDAALQTLFAETQGVIGAQAEAASAIAAGRAANADVEAPEHNLVRPPAAAEAAVTRLIELVRETNRNVHISSLSTARELTLLDPLKGDLPITTEISPHHLFLNADAQKKFGAKLKIDPPLRDELDRRALWTALKRNRVDAVGSGHAGYRSKHKNVGYWDAPSGIPGLDTMFPLLMSAVHHGRLGLERMVAILSENPARIFGLKKKGVIAQGYDADLVLFTEGTLARFEKADVVTKARWSPYVGRELAPKPDLVVVNGRIVARAGELVDDEVRGTEVKTKRG